ncbi:hypothetical protein D3C85_1646180 [compost metagenome]
MLSIAGPASSASFRFGVSLVMLSCMMMSSSGVTCGVTDRLRFAFLKVVVDLPLSSMDW